MSKKIRDVIHNYIYLTPIEEVVTENPLFLRLHYIHQNSFAYLTYPSAHNTRFSHSLGVMHIAGLMFQCALGRTTDEVIRQVHSKIAREILRLFPDDVGIIDRAVKEIENEEGFFKNGVYSSFSRPKSFRKLSETDKKQLVQSLVCLQAIRLAAMLHDVGHPPFSHIVEYALLEGLNERRANKFTSYPIYEGHEHASKKIAALILGEQSFTDHRFTRRTPWFFTLCASMAQAIYAEESSLAGLSKTILSGDLDADRLDYVVRDAFSAGMNLSYDVERLLDASYIEVNEEGEVAIAFTLAALPTIENFFNSRYDLYRWMIYHHDTTRRNLVIQRLITDLINGKDLGRDLEEIGKKFGIAAAGGASGLYDNYERFLDSSFVEMLWDVNDLVRRNARTPGQEELSRLLNVVLSRANYLLPSVCKSPGEYGQFARYAVEALGAEIDGDSSFPINNCIRNLNDALRSRFDAIVKDLRAADSYSELTNKEREGVAKYKLATDLEQAVQPMLDGLGKNVFVCRMYYIGSFQASLKSQFLIREARDSGQHFDVEELSPTLGMLKTAWAHSPQLMVYVAINDLTARQLAEGEIDKESTFADLRKTIGEALGTHLRA